jgi:hypothetical protein
MKLPDWEDFLALYQRAMDKKERGISLSAQESQAIDDLYLIGAEIDGLLSDCD